jgi:hypothetical protein
MTIKSITGKTTLQKVTKENATEVLHLITQVVTDIVPATNNSLGLSNLTMRLEATATDQLPGDRSKATRVTSKTANMTVKGAVKIKPALPAVKINMTRRRTSTTRIKLEP